MRTVSGDYVIDDDWIPTPDGWYHICIMREPKEIKYYVNGAIEYLCDAQEDWDN